MSLFLDRLERSDIILLSCQLLIELLPSKTYRVDSYLLAMFLGPARRVRDFAVT